VIGAIIACLEALAFSSVLAAGVAGSLSLAAGFALADHCLPDAAALAFAGTLVIYNIDRLRDLERDGAASPRRSAFVHAHRRALVAVILLAATGASLLAWRMGGPALALCGAVLLPSLFHRRIKRHPVVKVGYVTAAWVAVTAGLPVVSALAESGQGGPMAVGGGLEVGSAGFWLGGALVAAIYGSAVGANLIASNVEYFRLIARGPTAIWGARGLAGAGVLIALAGPEATRQLVWIPLAQLAGILDTVDTERHRLLRIDGLLLLGALVPVCIRLAV
jgi:4-hydroxybenzoate polyprenyltransferase